MSSACFPEKFTCPLDAAFPCTRVQSGCNNCGYQAAAPGVPPCVEKGERRQWRNRPCRAFGYRAGNFTQ